MPAADYAEVILLADLVEDLERVRIASANRLRALTDSKGIQASHVAWIGDFAVSVGELERQAVRALETAVARCPLGPFVAETKGLGAKTLGRLLKEIGDPGWHEPEQRPRMLRELYAYCGLHVVSAQTSPVGQAGPGGDTDSGAVQHADGDHVTTGGTHSTTDSQNSNGAAPSPTPITESDATLDPVSGKVPRPAQNLNGDHRTVGGSRRPGPPMSIPATIESAAGRDGTHARNDSLTDAGVAPARRRGQQANWSTQAKTRLYLIAESMIKHRGSAYRHVYDAGRAKYADAVHRVPCVRCGPSGQPAQPGSPLNPGHQHARALRLVMKAFLKDLWQAARQAADVEVAV